MNKNFKYILEERLQYMLTWQKESLEYFKHQQIQEKAKLKYYQDRKLESQKPYFEMMKIVSAGYGLGEVELIGEPAVDRLQILAS